MSNTLAQDVIHNKTDIYDYLALRNVVLRNLWYGSNISWAYSYGDPEGDRGSGPPPLPPKNHKKYRAS